MSTELQDLTVEQLRALAGERGITVPEKAKKAELIAAIEAAPAPADAGDQAPADQASGVDTAADTSGDTQGGENASDPASPQENQGDIPGDTEGAGDPPAPANPDEVAALTVDDQVETEREDGLIEIRRPIEHVNDRGDWTCPFSGLRVMAGSLICPQSGAHRDGDEAYIVTAPDEVEES